MRTVYAIQFSIAANEASGGAETMEELRRQAGNWVEHGYQRRFDQSIDVEFPSSEWSPMEGHSLSTKVQQDGSRELTTLSWDHLDDSGRNLVWRNEMVFARDSQDIDVSIRVRVTSPRFELRPIPDFIVGRPRFVTRILRSLPCKVGEQEIPTSPITVGVGEVEEFVNELLEDDSRVLPVVLLSQDTWSERPYIDPDRLLRRTLGHAIVAEIDKHAGFDLTGLVGRRFSCWDGAIRVYWPGFDRTQDDYSPLYLPERMDSHEARGEPIDDHLFNRLAAITILRHRDGEATRSVREHFRDQRRNQLAELRAELETKQAKAEELEQREVELLQALEANDELREENQRLQRELDTARENLADVARHYGSGEVEEVRRGQEEEESQPDSVLEAVVEADSRYSGRLNIWETAYESAEESDFVRPQEVFDAFAALAELSQTYFRSLEQGESMGPWENFFAERGLDYSPSEHETTMTQYGEERTFTEGDDTRTMERHLTLGGASRRNCVQIFFQEDQDEGTIHVGYCGRHLPFASQTT